LNDVVIVYSTDFSFDLEMRDGLLTVNDVTPNIGCIPSGALDGEVVR
jgi:hypothetical protein